MQQKWRIGVVSYLNAKPLVEGLDAWEDAELIYDVPARLPGLLDRRAVDAALVPVIDLFDRHDAWRIISDACIGCDGETLTVRIFSRFQPEDVRRLHVDGDSHTSVVLARIIWQECYGRRLEVVPFQGTEAVEECEAVLLIGDKVVHNRLVGFEIQTDLGSVWKSLTSLPFVFAVWVAPRDSGRMRWRMRFDRALDTLPRVEERAGHVTVGEGVAHDSALIRVLGRDGGFGSMYGGLEIFVATFLAGVAAPAIEFERDHLSDSIRREEERSGG